MTAPLPTLLVPGLLCSPRLWLEQLPELWRRGPVTVADVTRGETIAAIAEGILADAPPRFALAGLSMGGYVALELVRRAPGRVERLALLSTSARPDTPDQTERRLALMELAENGRFAEIAELLFPLIVHRSRRGDERLRGIVDAMAAETGPDAFLRQQRAIIARADSRPLLASIDSPTLVVHGEGDTLIPPENGTELAHGISGSKLVLLARCGHLSSLERPEETTTALAAWLDATPTR